MYGWLLWLLVMVGTSAGNDRSVYSYLGADTAKRPARCTYHRVHRLPGVDCSRRELLQIPQYLNSDTEVLDASYNRIRELLNSTFYAYSRMRYLYLGDNMIQTIEAGAFDTMPNLEALDLSINSIITVPVQIFQLRSLKNLYLQYNNLLTLRKDLLDIRKPIAAPLQRLNLAYCHLGMLPDLGILPDLTEFNISGNPFITLLPVDVAPYCSLNALDLTSINLPQAIGYCECLSLEKWLIKKVPTILHDQDELCPAINGVFTQCAEDPRVNETNITHDLCKEMILHRTLEYNTKMMWIIIASCISAILLIMVCVLYHLHTRNVKRTRSTLKAAQETNGNLETLLSN